MFLLCMMNAINSCWYGALEKPRVYIEFLLWLQTHSGCLVLKAVWGTTSDHPGQQDPWWGVEKLHPSRAACHQGEGGVCQGTVPHTGCQLHEGGRRESLWVLWVACLLDILPIPAAWNLDHLQLLWSCAFKSSQTFPSRQARSLTVLDPLY